MRKFILAVVVGALAAGLFATSASAFDSHFTVVAKQTSGHPVGHTRFRFRQALLEPHNRSERVGHNRVTCRAKSRHRVKCHALVQLNGKIGGRGDIRVVGNVDTRAGDNRLNVVGGTQQFNGVAGKVIVRKRNSKVDKLHFHLVR